MLRKHGYKIALILIFALGVALRFIDLGSADLWRDEAFSVRAANQNFSGMIEAIGNDTAPPLHTIIIHYWMKIFGTGEFSVRFPSFIAGSLTLLFAYLIIKETFKHKNAVLMSSFLVATSPVLIWYSQEARAYALFILMTVASLYYSIRLRSTERIQIKQLLFFILFTTVGLYTHNLFMFVAFVNFLLIITKFVKYKSKFASRFAELFKIFVAHAISGLIFLPWFFITLKQIDKVEAGGFWLKFRPIQNVVGTIIMFFTSEHYPDQFSKSIGLAIYLIWIVSAPTFLFSLVFMLKKTTPKKVRLLMYWFWGLMLVCWLYSFNTPVFYIRYLTFLVPAALIIMTYTLIQIKKKSKILFISFAAIIFAVPLLIDITIIAKQPDTKEQMSSLVKDIEFNPENEIILHTNAYSQHAFIYYSDFESKIYNPDDKLPYFEGLSVIKETDYYRDEEISGYKRVWVVYMLGQKKHITQVLKENYTLSEIKNYPGKVHLELWEQKQ